MPGGGISQTALEAAKKAESEAEAKAQHARAAAEKAAAEKAAADAKVVILESDGICPFVCSKSTVCFREMETSSFMVLHTKEASLHPV